jgi:hypothetical protein
MGVSLGSVEAGDAEPNRYGVMGKEAADGYVEFVDRYAGETIIHRMFRDEEIQ